MRKTLFLVSIISFTFSIYGYGQQFSGSVTTSGDITRTGNVGLGTSAPSALLHTNGTVRFESLAAISPTRYLVTDSNGNLGYQDTSIPSHGNFSGIHNYGNLFQMNEIASSGIDLFLFLINEHKQDESQIWTIGNTRTSGGYGCSNGLSFKEGWSANQTRLFLEDGTGNVGIGTTTIPANYKLAVAGKIIAEELKVQLQTSWPDYVFTNDYKLPTLQEVEKQIKEKGHLKNVPSAQEVKENGIELGEITRIQQEKIEELTLYIIELNKKLEALEAKVNDK